MWLDDLMLKFSLLDRHNWFDSRKRFINVEAIIYRERNVLVERV